jgi:hypothetical protein
VGAEGEGLETAAPWDVVSGAKAGARGGLRAGKATPRARDDVSIAKHARRHEWGWRPSGDWARSIGV